MINYGLDESQEEAIKWALERLKEQIRIAEKSIEYAQKQLERPAHSLHVKELSDRWKARREELKAHKKTFEEMISL